MRHATLSASQVGYLNFLPEGYESAPVRGISCDWQALRGQLLIQWPLLMPGEVDRAGHDRQKIALLVERRYGIASRMVENYLRNFERTLPLANMH